MIVAVMALIVFGFSLEGEQTALSASLSPNAFNGANAFATMNLMASQYPSRRPGSVGDDDLAAYVASQFRQSNLLVATTVFRARTVDGTRTLETVTGTSPGTSGASIVIVAHRDALGSPATAELSGTAALLGLANALSGETHSHTIVLASTSGSAGAAGAAQVARSLQGPIDAVIALGDLAGSEVREPIVVPWSGDESLAPPMLRNTLAAALAQQAELAPGSDSLGGQFAHLALPLSFGEQAPFGALGYPAVMLSLSGVHEPDPHEVVRGAARITTLGQAVLQVISALDGGPQVPAPSAYLIWNGNLIPAWALRVLVLALLAPVVITSLDGAARARRRGHRIMPWLAWVAAGALPFVLAFAVLLSVRFAGLIKVLPAGPVSSGAVPLRTAGEVILAVLALVLLASFAVLRPFVVRRIWDRVGASGAAGDAGAAAAVVLVICAVSLAVWVHNPFAAALLLPAAHLWIWVVDPDVRMPFPVSLVAIAIGLLAPAIEIAYWAGALGLTPVGGLWNAALLLAGGQVGLLAALEWSVVAALALSVILVAAGRRGVPWRDARIGPRSATWSIGASPDPRHLVGPDHLRAAARAGRRRDARLAGAGDRRDRARPAQPDR